MTNTNRSIRLAALAAFLVALAPFAAHAQRKSPLEDAPAIRKRVELRETRFELGVGTSSTVTQDFFHTFLLGGRLAFHINDWLSIAGVGSFALANASTGFQDRLTETLPGCNNNPLPPTVPREPRCADAQSSMQQIKAILGGQLEFTPFTGKYSLFGKLFFHYDFYVFGGGGLLDVAVRDPAACATALPGPTGGPAAYCGGGGMKPGAQAGVGLHTFFNNWLALNLELRDFAARLNPSGRDVNGDGIADANDVTWTSTYMVSVNLTAFLPSVAAISP
jgi:outer membrane beta-barrel protein